MGTVFYALLLGILYSISLLPISVLYGISNLLYLLVFHVFGYRKPVVFSNLENSFPDNSPIVTKISG